MADKIEKTDEEWQKELAPEQFHVCRQGGTERSFTTGQVACVCRSRTGAGH
jgi:peptide methionine sulfoxide reductase MsrB